MMMTLHASDIRAMLWPQRLIQVRQSLNRSSLVIIMLGLISLAGNAFWVWSDRQTFANTWDITQPQTWSHPAYLNSAVIALIILYAMRQIGKTRLKLALLGYPLLEMVEQHRGLEQWKSVEPMTKRPNRLHIIHAKSLGADELAWKKISHQWIRRAEKAKRLTSPHIARVMDCGYGQNESFYVAVDLPKGVQLDDFIARFGPCPPGRAVYILAQIAHALQDAHAQELYSIDLRPQHIWLSDRATNADWITVEMAGYDREFESQPSPRDDLLQFSVIAMGLVTGLWWDEKQGGVNSSARFEQELRQRNIPFGMQQILLRGMTTDSETSLPPAEEMVQRMWALLPPHDLWNQDQAMAWWKDHAPSDGSSTR